MTALLLQKTFSEMCLLFHNNDVIKVKYLNQHFVCRHDTILIRIFFKRPEKKLLEN